MREDTNKESDRAATHYLLPIPDGIFGDEMEVEATAEGLEFGSGYSTLSWQWIQRAYKALTLDGAVSIQEHASRSCSDAEKAQS